MKKVKTLILGLVCSAIYLTSSVSANDSTNQQHISQYGENKTELKREHLKKCEANDENCKIKNKQHSEK